MRYFDFAMNHRNAAEAVAVARVARECRQEGNLFRVEASPRNGERFYSEGGRYDMVQLARDCQSNGYGEVVLSGPNGERVEIASARY